MGPVVISLVFVVIGVALLMYVATDDNPALFGLGLIGLTCGLAVMYEAGKGDLAESLNSGEVREVVCTAPVVPANNDGKVGALLRKPDGGLEAVVLSKEPPAKHFVVTSDKNNPYASYPGK